ncbi:pyridoxal-dependent decarboxylase [Botrytis cinerea]
MAFSVASSYDKLRLLLDETSNDVLPAAHAIAVATQSVATNLPTIGLGEEATAAHLLSDITPGFNGPKTSSNYYGFVTGGVFPIAEVADNIVTAFDQNVQVHLPDQSVSTIVEDKALGMLADLLNLGDGWDGRTFTTGATGANTLGLACGREAIISRRLERRERAEASTYKSASIVGLGRACVKDIGTSPSEPWKIDILLLEKELAKEKDGVASIVSLSSGEVNTGRFATDGREEMQKVRELCDRYGAWLHVDGAFGIFAQSLPNTSEFASLKGVSAGIQLADSITGDGHKMLNVPYDCGFFFTKSVSILTSVFRNPNAAYLSSGPSSIPSPLNIGLENSRRFRALPVYAVLLAYGREGLSEMFARQVRLARGISKFLDAHVGTKWEGRPACRFAISTWKVEVEKDLQLIQDILDDVLRDQHY